MKQVIQIDNPVPRAINLQLFAEGDATAPQAGTVQADTSAPQASDVQQAGTSEGAPSFRDLATKMFDNLMDDSQSKGAIPSESQPSDLNNPIYTLPPADLITPPAEHYDFQSVINELRMLQDNLRNVGNGASQQQSAADDGMAKIVTKYGLPPDTLKEIASGLQDKLYENPEEFVESLIQIVDAHYNERYQKEVAPTTDYVNQMVRKQQVDAVLSDFGKAHPDLEQYSAAMQAVVEELKKGAFGIDVRANATNPAFLEMVYKIAKGENVQAAKTLDDYLSDEEAIKQIVANDNVKKVIMQNLASDVQNKQPPSVTGSKPSSSPVSMPKKPTSFREIGQGLLEKLK